MFGVFGHKIYSKTNLLTRGFDDYFLAPHSRYTEVRKEDIEKVNDLEILADSEEAGIYLVATRDLRRIFITVIQNMILLPSNRNMTGILQKVSI